MMVVLRDLTLLDGNYTHVSNVAFTTQTALNYPKKATAARALCQVQPTPVASLKRRTGYQDEQEGEARTKLSRMELDVQRNEQ